MPHHASRISSSDLPPARIALTPEERGWRPEPYSILRQVLGPDFHGPSSSHTAAPQLIALKARELVGGTPDHANVTLYNSFATTGQGHGTYTAITAGLLGLLTTNPDTPSADAIAKKQGLTIEWEPRLDDEEHPHPNGLALDLERGAVRLQMYAISTGGGNFHVLTINLDASALAA